MLQADRGHFSVVGMSVVGKVLLWVQASQKKRLHTGTDSKWPDTVFISRPLKGNASVVDSFCAGICEKCG